LNSLLLRQLSATFRRSSDVKSTLKLLNFLEKCFRI